MRAKLIHKIHCYFIETTKSTSKGSYRFFKESYIYFLLSGIKKEKVKLNVYKVLPNERNDLIKLVEYQLSLTFHKLYPVSETQWYAQSPSASKW